MSDDAVWAMAFVHGLIKTFPTTLLARLKPGEKRSVEKWDRIKTWNEANSIETRLEEAWGWLTNGFNLGLILEGSAFWVLDLDGPGPWPDYVHNALRTLHPPMVATPSEGFHVYFKLPADLVGEPRLKAHVCHPTVDGEKLQLDIKLGGKGTLVVAPGSRGKSNRYIPGTAWGDPPEMDPRVLFPTLNLLHEDGTFLTAGRSLGDRVYRGRQYLRKAYVSISGSGGHSTLMGVTTHLSTFLGLPEDVALALLTTPATPAETAWNNRCTCKETREPYPWSMTELKEALEASKGLIPSYGKVLLAEQGKVKLRDQVLRTFCSDVLLGEEVEPSIEPVPFQIIYMAAEDLVQKMTGAKLTTKRVGMTLREMGIQNLRKRKTRDLCVLVPGGMTGFFKRWRQLQVEIASSTGAWVTANEGTGAKPAAS